MNIFGYLKTWWHGMLPFDDGVLWNWRLVNPFCIHFPKIGGHYSRDFWLTEPNYIVN